MQVCHRHANQLPNRFLSDAIACGTQQFDALLNLKEQLCFTLLALVGPALPILADLLGQKRLPGEYRWFSRANRGGADAIRVRRDIASARLDHGVCRLCLDHQL